ncbi:hypothetical protein M3Y97_01162100 [Aphelenchoides bicaudatus]|nr:hypothetical protein M3Y97_01162100 [Aphelenchoides bicaudatus]
MTLKLLNLLVVIITNLLGYRNPFLLSNRFSSIFSSKFHKHLRYKRPETTKHIPCADFFDPKYDRFYLASQFRVNYTESTNEDEWPTDCGSIYERNHFYVEPLSVEEREFPLAYARNVFKDYRLTEMLLSATWAPQNYYCFSVDGQATSLFRRRMHNLASCFPNVHITNVVLNMDSYGHNTSDHYVECFNWLTNKERQWKYVMIVQNFDIPLKTNQEMVQILKWYNGTNDVSTQKHDPWANNTWTFEALGLFKDPDRNKLVVDWNKPTLGFTRSMVQTTVSRAAMDFITEKLNLTKLIKQYNSYPTSTVDEFLISSLNSNDNIQLPGGFTQKFGIWWKDKPKCDSQIWRHGVCIFGLEDLRTKFTTNHFFIINKMIPEYDYSAIVCWNEVLFNRTFFDRGVHRLNKDAYVKLPQVRLNAARRRFGKKFDMEDHTCERFYNDTIGTVFSEWN